MDAKSFVEELAAQRSDDELVKVKRHYKGPARGNQCLGVRMGTIFELARTYADLSLEEIEMLLESPYYEVRMGGVSVMDFQARRKKTGESRRKELFDLYLRRHDRINNWDLVDRSAPYVVGGYLYDKPRDCLYELASSRNVWERRTAIVATYYFIRLGDLDDTFGIAQRLIADDNEYVQKAVGSWLREAGKRDQERLRSFLDGHARTMPRVTLRLAIQKLDGAMREKYMAAGVRKAARSKTK